jgi:hypothetical protein
MLSFLQNYHVFSWNMALHIKIVNGHEDLLSPFVRNFEFAYVLCGKWTVVHHLEP